MARTQIIGGKKLIARLKDLEGITATKDIAGKTAARKVFNEIIRDAATTVRDQARSNARSQGLDQDIVNSIFRSADEAKMVGHLLQGQQRRATSGLAGVRTGAPPRADGDLFIEWKAGGNSKNPRAKSAKGRLIGSSRAALYERGYYTRSGRLIHKPFFQPAVRATKARVVAVMTSRLKDLIDSVIKD